MMRVGMRFTISAAHRLPGHGQCANIHGHTYRFDVELSGDVGSGGMVVDFHDMDEQIGWWVNEHWDHSLLLWSGDAELVNWCDAHGMRVVTFDAPPTIETLCAELGERFNLARVVGHEGDSGWAEWTGS